MNKKGFTVVELIISFSLTMAIAVFLFQIVIALKDLYNENGYRTQLLNKQAVIANQINRKMRDKGIRSVTKCGDYCILFTYLDSTTDQLTIDVSKNAFTFGNYMTILPTGTKVGNISVNVYNSPVMLSYHNDSIMVLDIPLTNTNIKGNFNVTAVYQYHQNEAEITNININ